jgi:carbamoyltransferase
MRSLGIVYGHDATVCLVEDGRVVFCQSEERLNRLKGSSGFPHLTLAYVHDKICPPESIDIAVLYEREYQFQYSQLRDRGFVPARAGYTVHENSPDATRRGALRKLVTRSLRGTRAGRSFHDLIWRTSRRGRLYGSRGLAAEAQETFARALRMPVARVVGVDHHLAHAYSTLGDVAGWGRALVLTLDGWGDGKCSTVHLLEDGSLQRLSEDLEVHSLGIYYLFTTLILGFRAVEDEYKVMGLAAYARPEDVAPIVRQLRQLIGVEHGRWISRYSGAVLFEQLKRIFHLRRFDHVAGAIQQLAEELTVEWLTYWIRQTGCNDVALAGGVFMNVKVTQRLMENAEVGRLYVVPAASDASAAIGAAFWGQHHIGGDLQLHPLGPLYMGQDFSEEEAGTAIRQSGAGERYDISRPADVAAAAAGLIAGNEVVARCAGPMEFGPRALGNRSILAHPADLNNVRHINSAIKNRDFWMPFAPSILEEDFPAYVERSDRMFSPYMTAAFDTTPLGRRALAAAMHSADFTIRPQVVRRSFNPEYHTLITRFKQLTGIGAVLNTSFNLHGEPIVCTPGDAIRTVDASALNHLILGPLLLSRRTR